MTRVLHVLDQPGQAAEALALKLSQDAAVDARRTDPSERHAWLLLGGGSMRDAAQSVGLADHAVKLFPRPSGFKRWVPRANHAMRRWLNAADRVACWTEGAASWVGTIGHPNATPRFGQATLCAFAQQLITGPRQGGVRAALRERWGVDEDTRVVALLADRPERVDALAAGAASLFTKEALAVRDLCGADVRLLCHPLHKRMRDTLGLAEQRYDTQQIVQDAGLLSPWSVLAGCDASLAPQPEQAGLSILWADAMGLPVIAGPAPRLPMLGTLGQVTIARSAQPKHLADALTNWAAEQRPTLACA